MTPSRPERARRPDLFAEFGRGWVILLASAVGSGVGVLTSSTTLTILMRPLGAEFGWKRGDIASASSFFTVGLFLVGPWFGRLYDRYGIQRVGPPSVIMLTLTLLALTQLRGSIWLLYAGYLALGTLGGGTSYLAYSRAVTTWFDKGRGLALALTMVGPSLAAILIPVFLPGIVAAHGWRGGYMALAVVSLVALPLMLFFVKERERPEGRERASGVSLRQVLGKPHFWLMVGGTFTSSLGLIGVHLHLLPMMMDMGATSAFATHALSFLGIGVLGGRLGTGALLDRFYAPFVAGAMFLIPPLGFLLFHFFGLPVALALALMIGLALGAEGDVLSYLAGRYFGLKAYSEIFGWLYGAFALGSAASPLLIGALYRASGDYNLCLAVSAGLCVLAAILFASIRPPPALQEP